MPGNGWVYEILRNNEDDDCNLRKQNYIKEKFYYRENLYNIYHMDVVISKWDPIMFHV